MYQEPTFPRGGKIVKPKKDKEEEPKKKKVVVSQNSSCFDYFSRSDTEFLPPTYSNMVSEQIKPKRKSNLQRSSVKSNEKLPLKNKPKS